MDVKKGAAWHRERDTTYKQTNIYHTHRRMIYVCMENYVDKGTKMALKCLVKICTLLIDRNWIEGQQYSIVHSLLFMKLEPTHASSKITERSVLW